MRRVKARIALTVALSADISGTYFVGVVVVGELRHDWENYR
jgi:hypothetical protein